MAKPTKVKHHYITRYYLEGFADGNKKVWTFNKLNPLNPFANTATETAVIKKLYHLKDSDNIDQIEDFFSDEIEGPASDAFKELINLKFPNDTEREKLSLFFGMLMARTPSYIEHLNDQQTRQIQIIASTHAAEANNFRSLYKKIHPGLSNEEIEKDRKSIIDEEYKFDINRDYLLNIMVKCGSIFSPLLLNMNWWLIKTNSQFPFITSDNFINVNHEDMTSLYKPGLGTPGVKVHIPVSSQLSLLLINDKTAKNDVIHDIDNPPFGADGKKIDVKKLITSINKQIYCTSDKYVFANSNSDRLKRCFSNILEKAKLIEDIQLKNHH
ncbi:DUF4238 domain-containing protein [Legionella feeleii]|uniref:DUF4238 domain-containing protein n=1 Tax=Legionella feeleii TaxID=453 RepID=A0A378IVM4_9GAMM|nr:DUF4238 domain-containing protein [Legionella feeleii]STX39277.1 Uncharacterised protein [Legionella feeleii]